MPTPFVDDLLPIAPLLCARHTASVNIAQGVTLNPVSVKLGT
jgi:hypothetical protein